MRYCLLLLLLLLRITIAMTVTRLCLIRLGDDRVVLRNGPAQLLLQGPAVGEIAERLVSCLAEGRTSEEIVGDFPGPLRAEVGQLLTVMTECRLVEPGLAGSPAGSGEPDGNALVASAEASSPLLTSVARQHLASASVAVIGINLITRSLARSVLEAGLGRLILIGHPVLDNEFAPVGWLAGLAEHAGGAAGIGRRLEVINGSREHADLSGVSLIIATSDLGEAGALTEESRSALAEGQRFLPAWISDLMGHVGPLTYPFETACFRCYQLRADSNNPAYEVTRAVAREVTVNPDGRASSGFLPPMAGVVGEIAAMEAVKVLAGFSPSDAVGRLIQVNLVSFSATVRRVLKVPRCPDCSDVMTFPSPVLVRSPPSGPDDVLGQPRPWPETRAT